MGMIRIKIALADDIAERRRTTSIRKKRKNNKIMGVCCSLCCGDNDDAKNNNGRNAPSETEMSKQQQQQHQQALSISRALSAPSIEIHDRDDGIPKVREGPVTMSCLVFTFDLFLIDTCFYFWNFYRFRDMG
jgi:hypothetical protein